MTDRCDRCIGLAYTSAVVNDTRLHFCAHHFRKHELAIRLAATEVVDETYQLTAPTKGVPA